MARRGGPTPGPPWPPRRQPNRADARPPRPLLLPYLPARTGNPPAVLGRMRARTRGGAIVRDRLPEQVFVDRAENFLGQFHRPGLGSAQIVNINSCHISLVCVARAPSPAALDLDLPDLTYPFFEARFAAFNGSTVAEPANPRRSRGGFFALLIMMYPPFDPGTLPSPPSRFSSLTTPTIRRVRTVLRTSTSR